MASSEASVRRCASKAMFRFMVARLAADADQRIPFNRSRLTEKSVEIGARRGTATGPRCLTTQSEGNAAYQLDISRLRNGAVPDSKTCAGRVVVKGKTIAERRAITGKVVIVE